MGIVQTIITSLDILKYKTNVKYLTGKTFWIHVLVEQKDRISYFQWNFLITIKSCIFDVTEAYIRL